MIFEALNSNSLFMNECKRNEGSALGCRGFQGKKGLVREKAEEL